MQQISQKYKSAKVSKLNYKCHEVISSKHAHTLFRKKQRQDMKVSPKIILKRIPRIDPQYCKKEKQNETTKKIGKGIQ